MSDGRGQTESLITRVKVKNFENPELYAVKPRSYGDGAMAEDHCPLPYSVHFRKSSRTNCPNWTANSRTSGTRTMSDGRGQTESLITRVKVKNFENPELYAVKPRSYGDGAMAESLIPQTGEAGERTCNPLVYKASS